MLRTMAMHMRSKAYLRLTSRLRALRIFLSPSDDPAAQEASPLLVFIAVVMAFLFAILEADSHSIELQALGLWAGPFLADPMLSGP